MLKWFKVLFFFKDEGDALRKFEVIRNEKVKVHLVSLYETTCINMYYNVMFIRFPWAANYVINGSAPRPTMYYHQSQTQHADRVVGAWGARGWLPCPLSTAKKFGDAFDDVSRALPWRNESVNKLFFVQLCIGRRQGEWKPYSLPLFMTWCHLLSIARYNARNR